MKKPTNHLGSHAERLANFRLPYQAKLKELQQLTHHIQQAWQGLLPDTIVETLRVIHHDGTTLTISTNNHTAANHLTYNRQVLLTTLHQTIVPPQYITELKFRVIVLERITPTSTNNLQCKPSVKNVISRELSDSTKRNIAQLSLLVTDDDQLKAALQKLIKD